MALVWGWYSGIWCHVDRLVHDAEGIWCQHDPGHAFYRAKSGGIQWQAAIAASAIATSRLCVILLVSRLKGESQTL